MTFCSTISCECDENDGEAEDCFQLEEISSTASDFVILDKGEQLDGYATGVKNNLPFQASAEILKLETGHHLVLKTFWENSPGVPLLGEFIIFRNVPITDSLICLNLTNDLSDAQGQFCQYRVNNGDTNLFVYELDSTKINQIEVIKFDTLSNEVIANFRASFIDEEAIEDYFSKEVRLFNVEISVN